MRVSGHPAWGPALFAQAQVYLCEDAEAPVACSRALCQQQQRQAPVLRTLDCSSLGLIRPCLSASRGC